MIMHIVAMVLLGLVVGFIAKLIVPGSGHLGWVATAALGIAGAYVGGDRGQPGVRPAPLHLGTTDQALIPGCTGGSGDSAACLPRCRETRHQDLKRQPPQQCRRELLRGARPQRQHPNVQDMG